jgi:hypothetical protein
MRFPCLLSLFVGVLGAACSSTATGAGVPAPSATTNAAQSLPRIGEACTCTSDSVAVPPPVQCCAGALVCQDPALFGSSYSCDSATNRCTRSGVCMTAADAAKPPEQRSGGAGAPPAAPYDPSLDSCNPAADHCPTGTACHLDGSYWRCI